MKFLERETHSFCVPTPPELYRELNFGNFNNRRRVLWSGPMSTQPKENPFQKLFDAIEAGEPLPEVSVPDLKWFWEYSQTLPPNTLIGRGIVEKHVSPGANLEVILFRSMMLTLLYKEGELAQWQHGETLEEVVFEVAATFALNPNLDRFPGYAIIDELRLKTGSEPKEL